MTSPVNTSTRGLWMVVTQREIGVKLRDKTFITSTVITLLAVIGSMVLSYFMSTRTSTDKVAVLDDAGAAIVATAGRIAGQQGGQDRIEAVKASSLEQARTLLRDDKADSVLHRVDGTWQLSGLTDAPSQAGTASRALRAAVAQNALSDNAQALGVSVEKLTQGSELSFTQLEPNSQGFDKTVVQILAMVFAFLFYLSAILFGYAIAGSVVEEKQSRIVEILLTSIPSRQLLLGKVLGNTVLAVAQMALLLAAGMVGLSFTDWSWMIARLTAPALWFLVYFVLGFIVLACLWAAAGALASRSEDVQATASPLLMVVLAAFLFGMQATGTAQVVASYVPVASAITMPARLVAGTAQWWEPVVSIAITVATAVVTIWAGERIYRRSILHSGPRMRLKQAWSSQDAAQ